MRRARATFWLLFAAAAPLACAKASTEPTVLQTDDLRGSEGAPFDASEIVDLPSFTDFQGIDSSQIQAFLERTPYNRDSFLATYSSSGVRAAEAMVRAAQAYRLNPLVFLVRAQMAQGLVGEEFYPSPPSRVEYVFGCGCSGAGACDPAMAGFDRQAICLGQRLRASLDAIAANGATAAGWAPGSAHVTLDGQTVTPADASTAALYDLTPQVLVNKAGGTWLFWNLWQKYAQALSYVGAIGPSPTGGAWIGDGCKVDGNCSVPSGVCVTNYPGGLCTVGCTGDCPNDPAHGPAFCADFPGQGGYCLAVCNPQAPACRDGYTCSKVARFGDATVSQNVCLPK